MLKINPKFFPTVLMVLDLMAAVGYMPSGNWRRAAYWIAAAALTYTVTY